MPEQVVIDFVANTDSLQPAVSALESVTAADAQLGAEVKKTTATFADRQKALDQQNKSSTAAKLTLDQLSASVKELNKNVIGNASTKQVEQFATQVGQATGKATTLTTQLRALREQLSAMETAGKAGTKSFTDLAVKAAKLQDQIGDTAQRIRILASDTKNLDAALSVASGLAGAFAVAQGASALFGKENEDLQKALLKVQAALAILNGLQAVAATLNKDSAAAVVLFGNAQEGAAAKTGLYGFALKAVTAIQEFFAVSAAAAWAVATAGVTLLIAGVVLLIDYFSALNKEVEFQKKLQQDLKDQAIEDDKFYNSIRIQRLQQDLELAKARKASLQEIHDLEINLINERIAGAKKLADDSRDQDGSLFLNYQKLLKERELLDVQYTQAVIEENKKRADDTQKTNEKAQADFEKLVDDLADKTNHFGTQLEKATKSAQDMALEDLVAYVDSIEFAQDLAGDALEKIVNEVIQQQDDEADNFIKNQQKKLAEAQLFAQQFSNISNALFQFAIQLNNNEIAALEEKHRRGLISEKAYRRQMAEFQRKAAIAEKEKAMFNIVIATATAVISALASIPPNIPLSIGAGVTGALELAAVASRPIPSIPQFAKGTESVKGGVRGKDSVPAILMPGERIVPADINAMLGDIPNADLPKLLGVYPDLPYISNASMDAIEKYRSNGTAINYDLLAEKLGRVMAKQEKFQFIIDEKGFKKSVIQSGNKQTSLDNYYSWNG